MRSKAWGIAAYLLAWTVGVAVTWLFMSLSVASVFASARSPLVLQTLLAPLAGLAVAQLVFGLATRLWRGLGFWLWALPLVYGTGAVMLLGIWQGIFTPLEATVIFVLLPGLVGLWAAWRSLRAAR